MRWMRLTTAALVLVLLVFAGGALAQTEEPGDWYPDFVTEEARGRVLAVSEWEEIEDDWFFVGRQMLTVELLTGKFRGMWKR